MFEQIQQRVVNKIKNADLKPLDKLFSVCLDQIAILLMANPNQDAYETFSLFKEGSLNYQGAGHISDGSRSLIDYGGDLKGEYYQLQKKMNYTLTKVSGFWEHEVVFRMLYQYSEYLTYRTPFFYQG